MAWGDNDEKKRRTVQKPEHWTPTLEVAAPRLPLTVPTQHCHLSCQICWFFKGQRSRFYVKAYFLILAINFLKNCKTKYFIDRRDLLQAVSVLEANNLWFLSAIASGELNPSTYPEGKLWEPQLTFVPQPELHLTPCGLGVTLHNGLSVTLQIMTKYDRQHLLTNSVWFPALRPAPGWPYHYEQT